MDTEITNSFSFFYPETILVITILLILLVELFKKGKTKVSGYIAVVGLAFTLLYTISQSYMQPVSFFYQMLVVDPFSYFFKTLFILSAFLIIIFSMFSKELEVLEYKLQEYYALILTLTLGSFMMASSVNLLMMYLSLELVSLSSYILAGYIKKSKKSTEGALKYVIYGGVSSGLMLYGISIIYGMTGTVDLYQINSYINSAPINLLSLMIAVILVLAGFGFKISSVPFHFWAPDVYEGSPTPVTAFLSVTSKAAGFAMMIRFFFVLFGNIGPMQQIGNITQVNPLHGFDWSTLIIIISVASMVLGNFVAIWQDNIKRLLAYSSIAQAGYILLGLVVINQQGLSAMMIYIVVYLFMNLGAFFCAIMISNKYKTESIEEMKGIGYLSPFLSIAMSIFMFSLSGIPLTAGFIGKFYIFSALINANYIWLALVGLLLSVVSLYFYIKIVKNMFLLKPSVNVEPIKYDAGYKLIIILLMIPTILFGVYFTPLTKFAEESAKMFGLF